MKVPEVGAVVLTHTKPLVGAKGGRKQWPCLTPNRAFSVLCTAAGLVAFGSHHCPGRPAYVCF